MTPNLVNATRKSLLATNILYCDRFWSRLMGLLRKPRLAADEACWLIPCNQIHTFGMKYPIDIYFLDQKNEVIAIVKNVKPNRLSPYYDEAHSVIEFRSGLERNCNVGDKVVVNVGTED